MVILESEPRKPEDSKFDDEEPFAEKVPFFTPERRQQREHSWMKLRGGHVA